MTDIADKKRVRVVVSVNGKVRCSSKVKGNG